MSDRILVTGGHGAIGSWVVRELTVRGHDVTVIDQRDEPRVHFHDVPPARAVHGDIRDGDALDRLFATGRFDRVVHLAALVFSPCETDPRTAFEVNAVATADLLERSRAAGVARFVANSTKGTLGPLPARYLHPTYEPVPVDHPPSPRSIYETSKYAVERLIVLAREAGLSAACLRLSTTWGPGKGGASHGELGFHSDVLAAAVAGRSSELPVHPDQGFDLVYYGDVAAGIADLALAAADPSRPVYHLGSGRISTMAEFASTIAATFPGVHVTLGTTFPPGRNCRLDIGPLQEDAGYVPRFDLARAMANAAGVLGTVGTAGS